MAPEPSAAPMELADPGRPGDPILGRRIEIRGTVQGVGFRPWVYRIAHELEWAGSTPS